VCACVVSCKFLCSVLYCVLCVVFVCCALCVVCCALRVVCFVWRALWAVLIASRYVWCEFVERYVGRVVLLMRSGLFVECYV